jgi:hypothetical protein
VRHHPGYVLRLLRQLGWEPAETRSPGPERNQEPITAWINDSWPRVKTPDLRAAGSSFKMSPASRSPHPSAPAGHPGARPRSSPTSSTEAGLSFGSALLPLRRATRAGIPHNSARQRQPAKPDRLPPKPPASRLRPAGDPALGRTSLPPQSTDDRVFADPAALTQHQLAARLCSRARRRGGPLVQPQGLGASQPRRRRVHRQCP